MQVRGAVIQKRQNEPIKKKGGKLGAEREHGIRVYVFCILMVTGHHLEFFLHISEKQPTLLLR